MNEDTCVVVCGYAGDAERVNTILPYYLHHKCPVVILSPSDSPIKLRHSAVQCQFGGKRCYTGQDSLTRQRIYMSLLLQRYPYKYFLLNDSDSVCLSPALPSYLYRDKTTLWSNEVSDAMHVRPPGYEYPHLAFQPPYFAHRSVLEKLVAISHTVPTCEQTPFVDWVMMAWAVKAGIPHQSFPDGVSCPSWTPESLAAMRNAVANEGKYFVHSIKTKETLLMLAHDRLAWKRKHS